MKNPGFDFRFTLRYLISLAICAVSVYFYFIYSWDNTSTPIVDEDPVTITLNKGTALYVDKDCYDAHKFAELPRSTKATVLAMNIAYHNLLVATESGYRGFVKVEELPEGTIPEDHQFPGFDDVMGYCYSSFLEGFEGKKLEELESKLGFATSIEPTRAGFLASFSMKVFNSEDHQVYVRPKILFVDSLATDTILNKPLREWSWTQWNPLFRLPLWLGYKQTPKQWKGNMSLKDEGNTTLNIWYKSDSGFWQVVVNIILGIIYISLVFFIFIRLPILPFYPVITFLKYNYRLDAATTNGILAIIFFLVYLILTPFFTILLSSNIWNLIWTILLFGGGIYVYSKLAGKIKANKCATCNRYDSYELIAHEYSHTTIEQRARTHTTNETRRGRTTDGQYVDVNLEVHHTTYYDVEVKHFNDTYKCKFCDALTFSTSTEETEL